MKTSLIPFLLPITLLALPVILSANTGEALFMKNCKACHGADGKGQTPMGKRLQIKDYTKAEVQDAFTDEYMIQVIKEGIVNDEGRKVMLPFEKKMNDEEIASLVDFIRSLKE